MLILVVMIVYFSGVTMFLEGAHKDDGVIVNWSMGITLVFTGSLVQLITGSAKQYKVDNTGRVTETTVNVAPPETPSPVKGS